jgi:hypothetical protein
LVALGAMAVNDASAQEETFQGLISAWSIAWAPGPLQLRRTVGTSIL